MSQPYETTNRGVIWKNSRKQTDSDPDFTGKLDVDGVEYLVNAWRRPADGSPRSPALKFSIMKKTR